uniref:Ig-like domain-containing protein n=1 Tax=Astatotilapia calliptera TaxID=8154 RepID=A0A3P8NH33_ASTCA
MFVMYCTAMIAKNNVYVYFFPLSDKKTITAESGQNITLPCRATNNNILAVEWSRANLGDEYVLLYRDGRFEPDDQHPSFKNRDRQMKDGDVSLILKDVMINDAGTYECEAFIRGTNVRKRANLVGEPISIVKLKVDPPGECEKILNNVAKVLKPTPLLFLTAIVMYLLLTLSIIGF